MAGLALGARQEAHQHGGIEVEHPGTGELPRTELIEAQHWAVKSVPGRADSPLLPEHHNLVLANSHDPLLRIDALRLPVVAFRD